MGESDMDLTIGIFAPLILSLPMAWLSKPGCLPKAEPSTMPPITMLAIFAMLTPPPKIVDKKRKRKRHILVSLSDDCETRISQLFAAPVNLRKRHPLRNLRRLRDVA